MCGRYKIGYGTAFDLCELMVRPGAESGVGPGRDRLSQDLTPKFLVCFE